MRRSQMYKRVVRRNNVFDHLNRNVIYPNLFLSPDEINKQASVEIIELKSDEELEKEHDKTNYGHGHVWCYENDERERSYKINREARERRRRRIENQDEEIYNELFDRICTNFYEIDRHNSNDGTSGNSNTKCFTIINNHLSYETSSDDDVEPVYGDTNLNGRGTNDKITFEDANYNGYGEKRTVLLYTEKNNEISDLENIPNISTSSSSIDNDDSIRDINLGCIRRLATTIPTYIPKLYLPSSPTLPTVTEVLESYNKSSSNTDINQSKVMTPQMPINNWVHEVSAEHENEKTHKVDNHTFVCDALSPRERRRMKISMNIDKIPHETVNIDDQSKSADEVLKEKELKTTTYDYKTWSASDFDLTNSNEIHLQKPHIKMYTKIKPKSEMISEPLENENAKWIGDDTNETMNLYDLDQNLDQNYNVEETSEMDVKNYCGVNNSFTTNMSLLKPMEWTQFLPITGSVPSLHLSFETDIEDRKSWLIRLFTCFECCKRNNK